jgi:Ribonuclease G/E
MNRDDIIRMARESGLEQVVSIALDGTKIVSCPPLPELERFAALAAAAERQKLQHELLTLEKWKGMALAKDGDGRTVQEIEREAKEAEREECAKLLDEMAAADKLSNYYQVAALRIRERGAP